MMKFKWWSQIQVRLFIIIRCSNIPVCAVDLGRAMSRGLECRLIWIVEDLADSEALIVHNHYHRILGHQFGGTVASPLDLRVGLRVLWQKCHVDTDSNLPPKGKIVAVWYGSTMHYSLHSLYTELQVDIIETTVCHAAHIPGDSCYVGIPATLLSRRCNRRYCDKCWSYRKFTTSM